MLFSPLWCITLPLIIAGLPETQFEATLTYSDGERTVTISDGLARERGRDYVVLRAEPALIAWRAGWDAAGRPSFEAHDDQGAALARALERALDAFAAAADSGDGARWVFSSVIHRDTRAGASGDAYTGVAHRDLDELAVANLRRAERARFFVNAWLPLGEGADDVDPLALLLPGAEPHLDAAPFLAALGGTDDRTGLRANSTHSWVWFPRLRAGDVILWRSERVWHAAFARPGQAPGKSRRSADARFVLVDPPGPPAD